MTTYFSADAHFGHDNVINHAQRVFESIEDQEELCPLWEAGEITAKEVMERAGLKRGAFCHLGGENTCISRCANLAHHL